MATKPPNPTRGFSSKSPILLRVRTGIRLTFRGLCSPTRTPTTCIYKVVYPPARLWGLMGFNIALEDVQGQAKSPFRPITSKIVWRVVRRTSTFFKTVCIFLKYVRRLEASEGGPLWFWSLWPLMSPILGLSWCQSSVGASCYFLNLLRAIALLYQNKRERPRSSHFSKCEKNMYVCPIWCSGPTVRFYSFTSPPLVHIY